MISTTAKLLLAIAAIATAIPATGLAQPAPGPRPAGDAPLELSAQDREVLAVADQLAADATRVLEQWVTTQSVTEDRLFARFYFPIARTDPQKYTTAYDKLAERDLVPLEDSALGRSPALVYAIVTDSNGYVPAHNTRFAQPPTGNVALDFANSRSKRLLGDPVGLTAARSEARYLVQRTRGDSGEVLRDLSIPITVRGKHWGCVRIGYRGAE